MRQTAIIEADNRQNCCGMLFSLERSNNLNNEYYAHIVYSTERARE